MPRRATKDEQSVRPIARNELELSESKAPAVHRAVAILRLLTVSKTSMSVNGIARELGMPPSTCLHVLRALNEEGLVSANPLDKRYSIGLGLVSMARGALNGALSTQHLKQETDRIAAKFDVTAMATQVDRRDRMVILALARGRSPFGVHFDLGRRFPAYASATGRCYAAQSGLSRAELRGKFDALVWGKPPSFEVWMQEVAQAQREGVSADMGNYVRGYTIVAAPIFDSGKMVRSLVAINVQQRIPPQTLEKLKKHMVSVAQQLSA